jgi:hypothetical protein
MNSSVDTREKILSRGAAVQLLDLRPGARVVTGYFDPLLATHARRLREIGDRLIVSVRNSEDCLMPERARAEMVASLACVEFVIPEDCLLRVDSQNLVSEENSDLRRRAEFVDHVRRRSE